MDGKQLILDDLGFRNDEDEVEIEEEEEDEEDERPSRRRTNPFLDNMSAVDRRKRKNYGSDSD